MTTMKTKMLQPSIFLVLSIIAGNFCTIRKASTPEVVWKSYLDNAIGKADYKCPGNSNWKPVDCADYYRMGRKKSDIYTIWPMSRVTDDKPFPVFCDMEKDGGGWTVIQRRRENQRDAKYFFRNWTVYRNGFVDDEKNFWLGNEKIFALTNQKLYSVRFEMIDSENARKYADYDKFWIDDENNKYRLHIYDYKGNAGDSMYSHNNRPFSTLDQDNDEVEGLNCGKYYKSGWWFQNTRNCYTANLNAVNYKNDSKNGIYWEGNNKILVSTEIKIRPIKSFIKI